MVWPRLKSAIDISKLRSNNDHLLTSIIDLRMTSGRLRLTSRRHDTADKRCKTPVTQTTLGYWLQLHAAGLPSKDFDDRQPRGYCP